jgi:nitrate reductase gamma subunit
MTTLFIIAIVALLAGIGAFLLNPRLPRYSILVLLAAIPQMVTLAGFPSSALILCTVSLLTIWWYLNRNISGATTVTLGMLLNLIAMLTHTGLMPVHVETLSQHGFDVAQGTALASSKDIAVSVSPVWWLADRIPFTFGGFVVIASLGDLIICAGLIQWLVRNKERHHALTTQTTAPARS